MASTIISLKPWKLLMLLVIGALSLSVVALQREEQTVLDTSIYLDATSLQPDRHSTPTFLEPVSAVSIAADTKPVYPPPVTILHNLQDALSTMQDEYYELWVGKWTTAIDWTAAVMNTYLSATLSSFSNVLGLNSKLENTINKYFAQTSAFYFGEDAFSIRMQAYDDILWVVLEWLESINFIQSHSSNHYSAGYGNYGNWYGKQSIAPFAHRARIFYEIAEQGWDERLCGGGLTWNPRLLPYKNAITNQLYISASVGMYLYFPGDTNCSPVLTGTKSADSGSMACAEKGRGQYDTTFLNNAIKGYDWLKKSGMTNSQGLYADGFHIAGYRENRSKTTCDERNEMVYTYNQGVVLSGLRRLWEATGEISYLEDGHELVQNVIRATGWRQKDTVVDSGKANDEAKGQEWHGLGSDGILTEACDIQGTCNEDGQTFKGIFFHHFTAFCETLPRRPVKRGKTHGASKDLAALHHRSCDEYTPWVIHNAKAALNTRDKKGLFGAWWGAGLDKSRTSKIKDTQAILSDGAIDYRTQTLLLEKLDILHENLFEDEAVDFLTKPLGNIGPKADVKETDTSGEDPNTRGRGRTVETQGGGLSVVRAMWEFIQRRDRV